MKMRSIRQLIVEGLENNGGVADFETIFSYVQQRKDQVKLEAKDPAKTVRGILSKMKKGGIIKKSGSNFALIK